MGQQAWRHRCLQSGGRQTVRTLGEPQASWPHLRDVVSATGQYLGHTCIFKRPKNRHKEDINMCKRLQMTGQSLRTAQRVRLRAEVQNPWGQPTSPQSNQVTTGQEERSAAPGASQTPVGWKPCPPFFNKGQVENEHCTIMCVCLWKPRYCQGGMSGGPLIASLEGFVYSRL